jgi:hypothetical protein
MMRSVLSDEEWTALDEACWNAVGGRCSCTPGAAFCRRNEDQMDTLASILGSLLPDGTPMIERWKANRALRLEFPFLFKAKWPEGDS